MLLTSIEIKHPPWLSGLIDTERVYEQDVEKMQLAIDLARENVRQRTGGPFGAVIFNQATGRVVGPGVNMVVSHHNSTLHAEMVAIMMAQAREKSFTLGAEGMARHELFTSCEPCAMCLGAILWSGVKRLVSGATRRDAQLLQFDEGPVFPESYDYLRERGIEITQGLLRKESRGVLELYRRQEGVIYNG